MKIVYFNFKSQDKIALDGWKISHPEVELIVTEEDLGKDNMHLMDNAQGICLSQFVPIPESVYVYAKEQGVKVLATRSAGVDMYNRKTLNSLDIKLTNVPSYSPNAIAEHVLAVTLHISRHMTKINNNVNSYNFTWNQGILSRELRTLTVGLLGTGRIGNATAKLFKGMGANVLGYDPYPSEEAKKYLTYVDDLDELVSKSDILSLHMPASEENYHLVNDDLISKLPDQAIIINAARGMLVDTQALIRGLDSGKLLGAAIDVYENESSYIPKDFSNKATIEDSLLKELIRRDDVVYTPHIAFFTETAVANLVQGALDSALNVINTGYDECIFEY